MATQPYSTATAALVYPARGIKLPGMSKHFERRSGLGGERQILLRSVSGQHVLSGKTLKYVADSACRENEWKNKGNGGFVFREWKFSDNICQ